MAVAVVIVVVVRVVFDAAVLAAFGLNPDLHWASEMRLCVLEEVRRFSLPVRQHSMQRQQKQQQQQHGNNKKLHWPRPQPPSWPRLNASSRSVD